MAIGYDWNLLNGIATSVRRKLAIATPGTVCRVTVATGDVPTATPHPIEIFAFTAEGSRPDPDVSTPLAALKHAFRDDPFDIWEDPLGRPLLFVQTRKP